MGFFDDTGLGLQQAGKTLERGAAVYEGRGPQFDLAQQNIAESQQNVKLKKLAALREINNQLQDLALSSIEDPKVIEPKLRELQKISKDIGIPFDDKLVEHYRDNALSLATSYDPELVKDASPQEIAGIKQLTIKAMKGDVKSIEELDLLRAGKLAQRIQKKAAEIEAQGIDRGEAIKHAVMSSGGYLAGNPKNMSAALDMIKKYREATVGTEDKSPSVGPDREALAQEMGYSSFSKVPTDQKTVINKEVKRREDERLAAGTAKEDRLASQFGVAMSKADQRIAQTDQRIALQEEQQRRILPSQQKVITGNKAAIATVNNYEKAYDEYIKESKGGALSDIIRGGIAKNLTAQRATDLVTIEGRTPAEKRLAAEYNAMIGSIKQLTDEPGVMTDADVPRIMGSFNPAVERGQFKANIQARRKIHQRAIDTQLEDLQAMGKDVSGFVNKSNSNSGGIMRSKSKSDKPIVSKDGGKTWEYE